MTDEAMPPATDPARERVLIVDDEKNIRRTVRMVLEGEGYTVEEASSGEEALARIAEIAADVVLLDVQLPGMSGLETIERISKLKNLESAPTIIMISGHATLADAVRATKVRNGRTGSFEILPSGDPSVGPITVSVAGKTFVPTRVLEPGTGLVRAARHG